MALDLSFALGLKAFVWREAFKSKLKQHFFSSVSKFREKCNIYGVFIQSHLYFLIRKL